MIWVIFWGTCIRNVTKVYIYICVIAHKDYEVGEGVVLDGTVNSSLKQGI